MPTHPHLSPEQIAEEFDVSLATVYKWRTQRTGPPGFRVGRHVRYRRTDVDSWVAAQLAADRSNVA